MTDFKQYLLDEFVEDYQEGLLTRRDALKLIAGITGSVTLASSILAACTPPDQPTTTIVPQSTLEPTATPVPDLSHRNCDGDRAHGDVATH